MLGPIGKNIAGTPNIAPWHLWFRRNMKDTWAADRAVSIGRSLLNLLDLCDNPLIFHALFLQGSTEAVVAVLKCLSGKRQHQTYSSMRLMPPDIR
ncbi:hypothetical protein FIBSPDRAFT_478024 [Athelia psychrophila]|uniref:Uncharacterized protein n=1 Tax=Athelia psychrophila TaxID=1759441 RepID=A0A166VAG8_9AGAM|nr:hypothetical protein FIBSPDRAFT_478024 [Fibularhizoctonia sp. CBS 109695]